MAQPNDITQIIFQSEISSEALLLKKRLQISVAIQKHLRFSSTQAYIKAPTLKDCTS
jgi:hypothetical protein